MKRLLFAAGVLVGSISTVGFYKIPWPVRVHVIRVYDGDTFTAKIPNWPEEVGQEIGIRIRGIDTPEIRGQTLEERNLAQKARVVAESYLLHHTVEIKNISRDKYFRLDADVYVGGENLGELLLRKKLAKPYDGGTKPEWP